MAKVQFEAGDVFSFRGGHGVVVGDNQALLIRGEGRSGYRTTKEVIPEDAMLANLPTYFELGFALQAVRIAVK